MFKDYLTLQKVWLSQPYLIAKKCCGKSKEQIVQNHDLDQLTQPGYFDTDVIQFRVDNATLTCPIEDLLCKFVYLQFDESPCPIIVCCSKE